jgi:hypothetical protein
MTLPNEPHGFAVNVFTREIHKRHARHAASFRRTTPGGLAGVLHGQTPVLCEECFGAPKPTRTRFTSEPVKVVEKKSKAKPEDKALRTQETLVRAGYESESVIDAITTGDLSKVKRADDVEEPDGPPDED